MVYLKLIKFPDDHKRVYAELVHKEYQEKTPNQQRLG